MQKHRKYLVVTIWISTIAFVGAGFVGWGTYQYGTKSNSAAKVGDVTVTYEQWGLAYENLFRRYNQMFGGRLDEATAKQLGLKKEALNSLIYQALLKNFAHEYGIIVDDKELQKAIVSISAFQKDGHFSKKLYLSTLQAMGLKPKTFEANLKDELLVRKILSLLNYAALPLEIETFGSALFMADKIRYQILPAHQINVTIEPEALKKYWKEHRNNYMTKQTYRLAILWIDPSNTPVDPKEAKAYYQDHRYEFKDQKGHIKPFDEVRDELIQKVRLQKERRKAQLAYIDLKKGRTKASETKTMTVGDSTLTPQIWKAITQSKVGKTLKPKVVNGRYAIVKIEAITPPRTKTFKEAHQQVKFDYEHHVRREKLRQLAQQKSQSFQEGRVSPFITRDDSDKLPPLSNKEAASVLQHLFTNNQPKGYLLLQEKAVVYAVLEQKLLDKEKLSRRQAAVQKSVQKSKSDLLQAHLMTRLQQRYPIQIFAKDAQ